MLLHRIVAQAFINNDNPEVKDTVHHIDYDKNNNKKIVAFEGDDAVAIKKAQESGNLDELRKATVGKYEQFKDWDLSTTGNVGFRSARGTDGWQLPWGAKEGRARVFDMYGDDHGNLFTKGGNWSADVKTGRPIDPATELTTATVDAALKDNRTKALDELKLISETWGKRKTNLEKKIKDILFERGMVLTYEEVEPSSPDDMYEVTFYLNDEIYKTMFIRHDKSPKKKAFTMLLAGINNEYYNSVNIGNRVAPE